MAMTNEQLTKWIDEIFGTIDEIKQNSGDISGLSRSVRQLREDLTATQEDVSDLEDQTAGTVTLPKAALQHFTDGSATQALDLVADIIPVQAGTGDPSPTNVRAITGYSSVTATAAGKNILALPTETITDGTTLSVTFDGTSGSVTLNGTRTSGSQSFSNAGTFDIEPGNYIFSCDNGVADAYFRLLYIGDDGNNVFLKCDKPNVNIPFTITSKRTVYKQVYYAGNASVNNVVSKPMLRLAADEDSTFEPYTANTATISLGSTVYGGTVNFVTGELVVDKAIVDLGTLNWTYKDVENPYFYSEATSDIPLGTDMLCSSYKVVDPSTFATGADLVIERAYRTNDGLNIRDTNYTDATLFKAALDGVKLVYPLTTPTTTTLTPAQLSLLQGENNVSATSGPITLTYAPDNVLAEIYAYIQKRFDTLAASLTANRTTTRKTTKTLTKKED